MTSTKPQPKPRVSSLAAAFVVAVVAAASLHAVPAAATTQEKYSGDFTFAGAGDGAAEIDRRNRMVRVYSAERFVLGEMKYEVSFEQLGQLEVYGQAYKNASDFDPRGICPYADTGHVRLTDRRSGLLLIVDLDGPHETRGWTPLDTSNWSPEGVFCADSDNMWVVDSGTSRIYRYDYWNYRQSRHEYSIDHCEIQLHERNSDPAGLSGYRRADGSSILAVSDLSSARVFYYEAPSDICEPDVKARFVRSEPAEGKTEYGVDYNQVEKFMIAAEDAVPTVSMLHLEGSTKEAVFTVDSPIALKWTQFRYKRTDKKSEWAPSLKPPLPEGPDPKRYELSGFDTSSAARYTFEVRHKIARTDKWTSWRTVIKSVPVANPHKRLAARGRQVVRDPSVSPWVKKTWAHVQKPGFRLLSHWPDAPDGVRKRLSGWEDSGYPTGYVSHSCSFDSWSCFAYEMYIDDYSMSKADLSKPDSAATRNFLNTFYHELAHVVSLDSEVEGIGPEVAALHLYFVGIANELPEPDNGHICAPHELLADSIAYLEQEKNPAPYSLTLVYWKRCLDLKWTTSPDRVLKEMRKKSAIAKKYDPIEQTRQAMHDEKLPKWFADERKKAKYEGPKGLWKLVRHMSYRLLDDKVTKVGVIEILGNLKGLRVATAIGAGLSDIYGGTCPDRDTAGPEVLTKLYSDTDPSSTEEPPPPPWRDHESCPEKHRSESSQ